LDIIKIASSLQFICEQEGDGTYVMDFTIFVIGIAAYVNIIESLESFIKHFLDVLIISMFSDELHKGCQVNVCVWLHIHIGDNIILG